MPRAWAREDMRQLMNASAGELDRIGFAERADFRQRMGFRASVLPRAEVRNAAQVRIATAINKLRFFQGLALAIVGKARDCQRPDLLEIRFMRRHLCFSYRLPRWRVV
jgi:hypothetical protein